MKNIVETLIPQVAKTTFGIKMFKRITPLVKELSDNNSTMSDIIRHLEYHPGASAPQRMVFEHFSSIAKTGDWRLFAKTFGEVVSPDNPLSVLSDKGLEDFFQPH